MSGQSKKNIRRIRDPLHNLIEFDLKDELELAIWELIQSKPFQRLRRVKQLGFSELVYPGATHTRLAHSLGVFHTARKLMKIVRKDVSNQETYEKIALAAALVHDVGHGPFSHAFEAVGKRLNLKLADHEIVSDYLIRNGEIKDILDEKVMPGFAANVANMIKKDGKITLHNSVVSSQFDADRLDYMQRDRMMTGSQHAAIDLQWLLANLEIGNVKAGVDNVPTGSVPTFVIGPKAVPAAEAYILGLFQLYPTIYFHKTTRGAEKLFTELLVRVIEVTQEGSYQKTGLPRKHPLIEFANDCDEIEKVLNLDDTVIWGALSLMLEAKDPLIKQFAERLLQRKLYKCFDIREYVKHKIDPQNTLVDEKKEEIDTCCAKISLIFQGEKLKKTDIPYWIYDTSERKPYKINNGENHPLEQIYVKTEGGEFIDLCEQSPIVKSLDKFLLNRVYYDQDNEIALDSIMRIVNGEIENAKCKN